MVHFLESKNVDMYFGLLYNAELLILEPYQIYDGVLSDNS